MPETKKGREACPKDAVQIKCPVRWCKGMLYDVTPAIAESLGFLWRKCSQCERKWAIKVGDGN